MNQPGVIENPASASLSSLQPGDILLMMGHGPLSMMIAWCGDSIYSHAAIVADQGDLIEASAVGVRRYPLQKRLDDTAEYYFVDALCPHADDGNRLGDDDRRQVLAHAVSLLGTPYPLDSLATLGVLVAIRGKWPQHWLARLVVREALDHVIKDDPSHMMCSEVVYRSLAECDVQPFGRLAPQLVLSAPVHMPFPDINWVELWNEVWPLLRPTRQQQLVSVASSANKAGSPTGSLHSSPVDDEDLQDRANALRATLGLPPLPVLPLIAAVDDGGNPLRDAAVQASPLPLPHPNPKLVAPLDLANAKSNSVIGRLMQAPDYLP